MFQQIRKIHSLQLDTAHPVQSVIDKVVQQCCVNMNKIQWKVILTTSEGAFECLGPFLINRINDCSVELTVQIPVVSPGTIYHASWFADNELIIVATIFDQVDVDDVIQTSILLEGDTHGVLEKI